MRNLEGVNQQGGHRLQEGETTLNISDVPPIFPVYAIKISIYQSISYFDYTMYKKMYWIIP